MRLLVALCAALAIAAGALWLRLDAVGLQRDRAELAAMQSAASVESLRATLRLSRELAEQSAQNETQYLKEKQRAEDESESLRTCLATGTCGLRVAATCPGVRVDGAGTNSRELDAGAAELTPAAQRAYPALRAGIEIQRAQIMGLQQRIKDLERVCKLAL